MSKAYFTFDRTLKIFAEGFNPVYRENGDFWRLHLDYGKAGYPRELGVYSHSQKEPVTEKLSDGLRIIYDSLTAEDGSEHDITLTLEVKSVGDMLSFSAAMENRSSVRLNELQYPFLDYVSLNGALKEDVLYLPNGLGRRIPNPHRHVGFCHSEYMGADYKNIKALFEYPAALSMPWLVMESGNKSLYMGCHSETCRWATFTLYTEPREEADKPYMCACISSYPVVNPGETVTYGDFTLAVCDGDWRKGADIYKESAKRYLKPVTRSESVKKLNGWQRIIMKHQHGELFHRYCDLPRVFKEGQKYGIDMILLFAWWQEGMDNGYPNYMPDEMLGGEAELRKAIKEINDMGGRVVLYANGHIIDVATDYYKTEGYKYTMKDFEQNEYREFYMFTDNGTLLSHGHKCFVNACHGTEEWREKLYELEQRHLDLGSNGTFFDQLCCAFRLCFDSTHTHGKRIDLDGQLRTETVAEMRKMVDGEGHIFGTEGVMDRVSVQVDFVHGCGVGMTYTPDAYPYIFRYIFPDIPVTNRYLHDEVKGWEKHLNYAFVFGLLFDIGLYRCRAKTIEVCHDYAEYVKKIIDLREPYRAFFTDGKFDLPDQTFPAGVWAAKYTLDGKSILTLWNDTDTAVTVNGVSANKGDIKIIEL